MIAIAPGVCAWRTPGDGWGAGNAGLVSGHKASLLVDTLWDLPRTAAMLEAFRVTLEAAPLAQVVNTHADGDHWFGNQLTGAREIIATEAAGRAMRRHGPGMMRALGAVSRIFRVMGGDWRSAADYFDGMLRPFDFSGIRPVPATSTFSGSMEIEVGGRRVQLVELGPAHTAGDLVVYLPDERLLFAGDILFSEIAPVLWDGSAENWIRACEKILSWKVDVVVPGHGPVTDLAGVEMMRAYWEHLARAARSRFERGESADAAARHILASDEYRAQKWAQWSGQERIAINVHAIYRGLRKETGEMSVLQRINVLRKAALLERQLH